MADATLKTDYKDDVLDTSKNTQRKYQMIQNEDGTVSFVDVTEYSQMGDSFGAKDVNAIAEAFNELNSKLTADDLTFQFATDGEGNYGYLGADDSFIPFKKLETPLSGELSATTTIDTEFTSGYVIYSNLTTNKGVTATFNNVEITRFNSAGYAVDGSYAYRAYVEYFKSIDGLPLSVTFTFNSGTKKAHYFIIGIK